MSDYDLNIAKTHLNAWLEAELTVATAQSYTIGTRTLTRANLAEIRKQIKFWQTEVSKIENKTKGKGRNRGYRFLPRDL